MSDLEAALAAHLNGKFFWEHTANLVDHEESRSSLEIRRAQKAFAQDAQDITARNKDIKDTPKLTPRKAILEGDQKVIEPIVNAICSAYNVSARDLLGRSTSYKFAKAKRHLYWALFRYMPGLSFKEAGRIMAKCHTTVMHGKETFQANQDFEKVVEVDRLMGKL